MNTEAGPLSFPEDATVDELNCTISNKGSRRRRLGIDYENGYAFSTNNVLETTFTEKAITVNEWSEVAENGNLKFTVIQINDTLHFYDSSGDAVSTGKKSFTVDLSTFVAPAHTDVGSEQIQVASGKGYLFVVSKKLKPFYITYDPAGDSITSTEIGIKIRDTKGVDDTLDPDEEIATMTVQHQYNLKNQGWNSPGPGIADPITTYKTSTGVYPSNAKQWWISKTAADDFDPTGLKKIYTGNTYVPRGHYLVTPFNIDRNAVSGLTGLAVETEDDRPSSVAFYAGRVWYGFKNRIYFSQIIEDTTRIWKCFQDADPTTEEISDLIDTDGGVIHITDMGDVKRMFVTSSKLILFANNGTWFVGGSIGDGFRPTDYRVDKVSSVGIDSPYSLVDVLGTPIWWSDQGIFTLSTDKEGKTIIAVSMSEETIQTYFKDDIPALSKQYVTGKYDSVEKKVYWLFSGTGHATDYRFKYDSVLQYDVKYKAFMPWTISSLTTDSPYISGIFNLNAVSEINVDQNVVDNSGNLVVDGSANQVIAEVATSHSTNIISKFLVIKPDTAGGDSEFTFGEFSNTGFIDWETADTVGISFDSYLETGEDVEDDPTKWLQPIYIYFFFEENDALSSCYFLAKWDFSNNGNSGKWSTRRQVYSTRDSSKFDVAVSKHKVRGRGKSIRLRYESEEGKDFNLYGWGTPVTLTTAP